MDMTVLRVLLTLAIALLGTFVFLKLRVPAGAFVGAVLFVGVVQVTTGITCFPPAVKTFCSAVAGSYLGTKVRKKDLAALRKAPLAAVVTVVTMMSYNVFSGWLLSRLTDIDFGSAVLGLAPGGSTEFALVAADMGYSPAAVSILQMLRMAVIVPLIPVSIKLILTKGKPLLKETREHGEHEAAVPRKKSLSGFLTALAIGIPAGILGKLSGIPAGSICFPMVAVGTVNVLTDRLYFPLPARYAANSCNGALIGVRLVYADLVMMGRALPVILLIDLSWVLLSGVLGIVIYRLSSFTLETSLFCASPGGMSDMGLIAEDMGGNPTQVTVMQLCRLLCVMSGIPFLLHYINS